MLLSLSNADENLVNANNLCVTPVHGSSGVAGHFMVSFAVWNAVSLAAATLRCSPLEMIALSHGHGLLDVNAA